MVIGFVTPEYPDGEMRSGGIGTSVSHLANYYSQAGHQVFIIVYGAQHQRVVEHTNGITIFYLRNIILRPFSFFLTSIKLERVLNKLVRTRNLQVVEVPDWSGISALWRLKCPVVMRLNGSETYFAHLENRPVRFSTRWLERIAWKRSNCVISVSAYTAKLTAQLFGGKKQVAVIPNGIDAGVFAQHANENEAGMILYFGTLVRKKGVLELPSVFNRICAAHPGARLVIAGADAPDRSTGSASTWKIMKPLFDEKAIRQVAYVGMQPYSAVADYIAKAAVCVFPSFAEACPLSWLEAMAMKKAIVASNMPWASEIINSGEDGILEDPRNHDHFANAIIALLSNRSQAYAYGDAARKKVEEAFEISIVGARILKTYESALTTQAAL